MSDSAMNSQLNQDAVKAARKKPVYCAHNNQAPVLSVGYWACYTCGERWMPGEEPQKRAIGYLEAE